MGVTINYLLLIVNCEQEVGVQKNTSKKLKQNCGQKMWWKKISAAMPNTCKNKLWWKVHSYKRLISIKKLKKIKWVKKKSGIKKSGGQKDIQTFDKKWG